jgi:hypothetical protein
VSKLRELTLGIEAVEYIKTRLSNGKTLAHYLLKIQNIDSGSITTFLPSDVSMEQANKFQYGGVLPPTPKSKWRYFTADDGRKYVMAPTPREMRYLVKTIKDFLRIDESRLCIMEDALAKPNDPCVSRLKSRLLFFRDEVYYIVYHSDIKPSYIRNTIEEAESIPTFIGAFTSLPKEGNVFSDRQKISEDTLRVLAERTEKIFIGAYDGEGYLIWSTA